MQSRRGMTMMEVVIGTLLVGMVLASTIQIIGPTARSTQLAGDQVLAAQFAEELLAEITAQPYKDKVNDAGKLGREPDETGPNRSVFDDVDDYDGWSGAIVSTSGTARTGLVGTWTRSAAVVWLNADNPALTAGAESGVKRVTVTVRRNGVLLATGSIVRTAAFDTSREE